MNKKELVQGVLSRLQEELEAVTRASKASMEAATHEENKPENEYDTRGLEASYLASAQTARVGELQKMLQVLQDFSANHLIAQNTVQPGAVVELLQDEKPFWIFLLPCGAGLSVEFQKNKISVVTTSSPFGQEIRGKKIGDQFEFSAKGAAKEYEVMNIY